jgi:predicted alpha/beta superfamily hydrolase
MTSTRHATAAHISDHPVSMLTLELYTPSDDLRPIFVAGNFNDWTTRDERFKMQKVRDGHYQLQLQVALPAGEALEYKYVKGGWESEELGNDGHPATNRRTATHRGKIMDVVPHWKQHGNWYDPQFYPDIRIVAKRFNIPQLRRRRRISVLLPWNYTQHPDRHYPVLYLQDGQNLFEDGAPFGTWGVDKQLAYLAQHGKGDLIVVAIDHGGKERIREFSPYETRFGDGMGRDYARFLAETLKPYIDKNFRTLGDRANTGVGGSSMGGLISIYAGVMFPEVFSKFMIFSPSLWVSQTIYLESLRFHHLSDTKIYFYAGGKESRGMVPSVRKFKNIIEKRGYRPDSVQFRLEIDPEGKHNEARWGYEFPKAADWLFNTV